MVTGGFAPTLRGSFYPGASKLTSAREAKNHRVVTEQVHDAGGKIAMQLSYASFLQPLLVDYPDFQMGVAMPPGGPLNDLSLGGVGYWMMAEASKNKDAAWALMEYLTSAEVMNDYAKLSSLFPCRTDVNPFAGDALSEAFQATQKNYMRLPALPFDYWGIAMPEYEAALNGQESAADALDASAKRINDRISEGS